MKYFIRNDFDYLLKKRLRILIIMMIFPVLIAWVNVKSGYNFTQTIIASLGLSIKDGGGFLTLIAYLFNITIYLFLAVDIYIKDIRYQLDNLFLRMKLSDWYLKKSVLFVVYMFILKLLQHVILSLFIYVFGNKGINISSLYLFIYDFIYIIVLQSIFMLVYSGYMRFKKFKLVFVLIQLLTFIIIPKDIIMLKGKIVITTILVVLITLVTGLMFKKGRKIIENVRGV